MGVGYSYVEDDSLLVTTDLQAAADMTTLLKALVKELPTLKQGSPLFLVAESYGGKYAATLGVSVVRAVRAGELKLTLGGMALGDSWISPEDFAVKKSFRHSVIAISCSKYLIQKRMLNWHGAYMHCSLLMGRFCSRCRGWTATAPTTLTSTYTSSDVA